MSPTRWTTRARSAAPPRVPSGSSEPGGWPGATWSALQPSPSRRRSGLARLARSSPSASHPTPSHAGPTTPSGPTPSGPTPSGSTPFGSTPFGPTSFGSTPCPAYPGPPPHRAVAARVTGPASLPILALLAFLALLALARLAVAAPPTPSPPPADDARAQAKAAVERGHAAFDRGDYTAAINAFEEAMALRPSPKLHFNVGVCEQRLMEAAVSRGESAAESAHAAAAIAAFNRYLAEKRDAPDRAEVEATIRSLGGTPVTAGQLKPAPTAPAPTAPAPSPEPEAGPVPDDEPPAGTSSPTAPPKATPDPPVTTPAPSRGHFGGHIGLWSQPQLEGLATVEGAGLALFGLEGAAHLGRRRALRLGGVLDLAASAKKAGKLALTAQVLALTVGAAPRAGDRFEFPLRLALGLAREALQSDGKAPIPCAVSPTAPSQRLGGVVGGRVGAAVLVGARRNHGLGLHLGAAFTGYGQGTRATGCNASPFVSLQIPRARGSIAVELAYTVRF